MKRVFEIDPLICPRCGAVMKIKSLVTARLSSPKSDPREIRRSMLVLLADGVDLGLNVIMLAGCTLLFTLSGVYAVMLAYTLGYTANGLFLHLTGFRGGDRAPAPPEELLSADARSVE